MTLHPSHDQKVTVSIVSHGQLELIAPLLEQLDRWCHSSIARVVLTINIPEAEKAALQSFRFPVQVIHNLHPLGFGANHNQAFEHCETTWFLVLNPDIRLDDNAIGELLRQAGDHVGLLAPRIQEPGKSAPEPYRGLLTPLELLRRRRPDHTPPNRPVWVAGMFMLLRADAYRAVGGFDTRFFMYCEDFDICIRLGLAGWRTDVIGNVSVRHEARRSSHAQIRHLWWHLSSLALTWTSAAFWRVLISGARSQR